MADGRHDWFLRQVFCHRASLSRYLRKFTSNAEDVADLVQEAFVRMYAFAEYEAVQSARSMLFTVAHNLAVERIRRQGTQATECVADIDDLSVCSQECGPEDRVDADRRLAWLCRAMEELPPLCRRVFVLRKVHQLSHSEISQVLGVSHSTIEKHVAKGMLRCRSFLQARGLLEEPQLRTPQVPVRRKRGAGEEG